jgi:hypothetical protein
MTKGGKGKKVRYPKKLVAKLGTLSYYTDPEANCTTNYYYLSGLAKLARLVVTDGIKIMCERLKCYWVVDHVVSIMPRLRDTFYVVYIVKNPDDSFYFILDDGNENIIYCKRHPYTNIKANLKLFLSAGEQWVLYLPSEH